MISAPVMDAMRATLVGSLPDICDLATEERVPDGSGGWIDSDVVTSVACRVSPLATAGRDFESYDAAQVTSSVPWIATFPPGTLVGPSDTFEHQGNHYEVIASSSERTWEIDVRVVARRVA